jgi:hypothetical protein
MDLVELNKYGIKEDDPILFVLKKNREELDKSIDEVAKRFITEFSFLKEMEKNFVQKNTLESMVNFLKVEVDFIDSQRKSIVKLKRFLVFSISLILIIFSISSFVLHSNYRLVRVKNNTDGTLSYSLNNFLGSKCIEVGDGLEVHGKSR